MNVKRSMRAELETADVSISVDSGSIFMAVAVTATGSGPQACIQAANAIAVNANDAAVEVYAVSGSPYRGKWAMQRLRLLLLRKQRSSSRFSVSWTGFHCLGHFVADGVQEAVRGGTHRGHRVLQSDEAG